MMAAAHGLVTKEPISKAESKHEAQERACQCCGQWQIIENVMKGRMAIGLESSSKAPCYSAERR
jgi:hypothetical protein